jgi:hypothetical protein
MMTSAAMTAPPRRRGVISRERAIRFLFGAMIFLGFFVFVEPAPFDLLAVVFIPVVLFTGFRLNGLLLTLSVILLLYNLGGFMSLAPWWHESVSVIFTVLSLYLAILCVFLAAFFAQDPVPRAELCMKAYTASAIVVAITGIMGYFNVFGLFETLTLYGRAKGTFKDPNVYGPYLALGALYLMQLLALNRTRHVLATVVMLAVILFGLLLSFSRGAWGAFVVSASLMIFSGFLTAPNARTRKRIVVLTIVVVATSILAIVIALLDEATRDLLVQRFAVTQYYDEGEKGRFGAQLRSLTDLIEMPNGYGPMRYKWIQGGDPHNSYVNAFASYGWLGGFSFIVLVAYSYFIGFRLIFKRSPVQHAAQVFFPCLFTSFLQAMQIDIDHWRHVFLFIAAVWGLEAARLRWLRTGVMGTLSSRPAAMVTPQRP